MELSVFDDGSTDETWTKLNEWAPKLEAFGMRVVLGRSGRSFGGGCGYAKNRGVLQSTGSWLMYQDVDDVSMPRRLE